MLRLSRLQHRFLRILSPLLAICLALIVNTGLLLVAKINPLEAYGILLKGAFGSITGFTQTLVKASPLLLVSLGICIAFRGGVFNIGGEGQFIVGSLAATAVAISLKGLPGWLLIPITLLSGAAAGGIWGGIPGILKARLSVNEVLSTIMMNVIAFQFANYLLNGPMMDPYQIKLGTRIAETAFIPIQAWLGKLIPQTQLHSGVLIALALAILVYVFLWRTTIGYNIRAVGMNPNASLKAGIRVPFYRAFVMVLSGAFAGLAGAIEVMGVYHKMLQGISASYGYYGIVTALFGELHPLGSIVSSILFGGLLVGGDKMQRTLQVPASLIGAMLGLIVLFFIGTNSYWRLLTRKGEAHE